MNKVSSKGVHKAVKLGLYPTRTTQLSQVMGCARWGFNYTLNLSITTYGETGKGIEQSALNACLPKLKKQEETAWLG